MFLKRAFLQFQAVVKAYKNVPTVDHVLVLSFDFGFQLISHVSYGFEKEKNTYGKTYSIYGKLEQYMWMFSIRLQYKYCNLFLIPTINKFY